MVVMISHIWFRKFCLLLKLEAITYELVILPCANLSSEILGFQGGYTFLPRVDALALRMWRGFEGFFFTLHQTLMKILSMSSLAGIYHGEEYRSIL